jgi:hypothetical protein
MLVLNLAVPELLLEDFALYLWSDILSANINVSEYIAPRKLTIWRMPPQQRTGYESVNASTQFGCPEISFGRF